MWIKVSLGLDKISNGRVTFLATVIFLLFIILILPAQSAKTRMETNNAASPDMSFFYSSGDLFQMAEAYGEQGRRAYVVTRWSFDFIFPLVYTLFLGTAVSWVYRKAFAADSLWQRINLVPVVGMLFDYCENVTTSIVMLRYPEHTAVVDTLAPVFTMVKWVFVGGSFLVLFAGIGLDLWRRIQKRNA